jgi:glucose/arabinose dehydrogenase
MRSISARSLVVALAFLACAAVAPARAADEGLVFQEAWPGVSFAGPTCVAAAPDGSDRLFVALRGGKILVIRKYRGVDPVPQPKVFADLSAAIPAALLERNQSGLVSLAVHPDFKTNGRLFAFYGTAAPDDSGAHADLVEFRAAPGSDVADPASRRVVFTTPVPEPNHFGGGLAFGPDRMLYVGIGTWPKEAGQDAVAQDLRQVQGKILRIDVDRGGGAPYAIPGDNPFVAQPGARKEIWALGIRNPFRFSFDPQTGALWMSDPGSRGNNAREEIDVVPRGGNLGWPVREGTLPGRPIATAPTSGFVEPVFDYARDVGKCAIGGVVYRGQRCPSLAGQYVFSDYMVGKLMALTLDASRQRATGNRVLANVENVMSINEDAQGELYLCQLDNDKILTVVPKP